MHSSLRYSFPMPIRILTLCLTLTIVAPAWALRGTAVSESAAGTEALRAGLEEEDYFTHDTLEFKVLLVTLLRQTRHNHLSAVVQGTTGKVERWFTKKFTDERDYAIPVGLLQAFGVKVPSGSLENALSELEEKVNARLWNVQEEILAEVISNVPRGDSRRYNEWVRAQDTILAALRRHRFLTLVRRADTPLLQSLLRGAGWVVLAPEQVRLFGQYSGGMIIRNAAKATGELPSVVADSRLRHPASRNELQGRWHAVGGGSPAGLFAEAQRLTLTVP